MRKNINAPPRGVHGQNLGRLPREQHCGRCCTWYLSTTPHDLVTVYWDRQNLMRTVTRCARCGWEAHHYGPRGGRERKGVVVHLVGVNGEWRTVAFYDPERVPA